MSVVEGSNSDGNFIPIKRDMNLSHIRMFGGKNNFQSIGVRDVKIRLGKEPIKLGKKPLGQRIEFRRIYFIHDCKTGKT